MRKRKILYHRLVIVIIAFLLVIGLAVSAVVKVFAAFTGDDTVETVQKKPENTVDKAEEQVQKKVIVLDAGHGGYDDGSLGIDGKLEKNITLDIALKVGKYLEKEKNIEVVYVRDDDEYYWTDNNVEDLNYRVNLSYKEGADIFCSFHMNDTDEGYDIKGYEIYTLDGTYGENIAEKVLMELDKIGYSKNRGVIAQEKSTLHVIAHNSAPSILIEMGFINNTEDFAYITSEEGSNKLAKAIAQGLIKSVND